MMVLKKHGWYLTINLIIISFFISCKNNSPQNNTLSLECIIEVFLDKPPELKEDFVYISETQYWNDSTSIISISYSDIPPIEISDSIESKITSYNGFEVVHLVGTFKKKLDESLLINSSSKWKKIDTTDYAKVSEDNYLVYSEYNLQFIYDFKSQQIINLLLDNSDNKSEILEKVQKCNN